MLVFVLWRTLATQEQSNLRSKVKIEAELLADQIEADLRSRLPPLQCMSREWEIHGGMTEEQFTEEARTYLSDAPGFQALGWVDKNFFVQWIEPLEGNEHAVNLNLAFEETRQAALRKARDDHAPTVTAPIDLVQGGKGFLTFFPVSSDNKNVGFILSSVRIREWLDYVFTIKYHQIASDECKISVLFDALPVYQQEGWYSLKKYGADSSAIAEFMGHTLHVQVRPTKAVVKSCKTLLPLLTAVFGVLLSVLVSTIIHLYQKTFSATQKAHAAQAVQEIETHEREKAERELQRALARIDLATKASNIGIWTWDLSINVLTWNERMFELFNLPSDVTPTYEVWRNSIHPDDVARVESLLNDAVQGKAIYDTEFRIVLSDGAAVRHVKVAATVERDREGNPQYITGLDWDMTAQRQKEEALKKSEERVRLLLNSTGEAIYGIDLNGDCTFANATCAKMLGYPSVDGVLGNNMHFLIHHSYADGRPMPIKDCRIFRAFLDGKEVHVDDEVLWRADGTFFPAEYWSSPIVEDGKISGAVVTFVDITQRKKAEALLATERQRLSNILEGTNVGTWEWTIQTGEIVFNKRGAELIGYQLSELTPASIETWKKIVHPDDLKRSEALLERHFKNELAYYECEMRLRRKDGSWVWVLERGKVTAWSSDGKPLRMSGTDQDITQRKQAEEERETLIVNLEKAISEVKKLSGMLPICASCKKIRDDKGYWNQIESYIKEHSEAEFSHSLCPECANKLYPDLFLDNSKQTAVAP